MLRGSSVKGRSIGVAAEVIHPPVSLVGQTTDSCRSFVPAAAVDLVRGVIETGQGRAAVFDRWMEQ